MITDNVPITDEQLVAISETVNCDVNPVEYLAIDPGMANGVCGYDAKYYLVFMYTIREQDLLRFLKQFQKVSICVIEDYTLYPQKAKEQIYSDMLTPRVIGRVENWAELNSVELIKQGARIKPTGYAWIGKKPLPKSNPKNHKMDAHVHFMYWAVKNGHIDARVLLRNPPQV